MKEKYEKQKSEITAYQESLPLEISRSLEQSTGHTNEYLTKFMKKYSLVPEDLVEISNWHEEYGIDFPHVAQLRDRGYNLNQIQNLLESREATSHINPNIEEKLTLEQIIRLSERFQELDGNPEAIGEAVYEIVRTIPRKFIGTSVKKFLEVAEKLGTYDLEKAIDDAEYLQEVLYGNGEGKSYPNTSFRTLPRDE